MVCHAALDGFVLTFPSTLVFERRREQKVAEYRLAKCVVEALKRFVCRKFVGNTPYRRF
jgi:hypothetical protein